MVGTPNYDSRDIFWNLERAQQYNGPIYADVIGTSPSEKGPMYWKTKDKKTIFIPNMENDHLINSIYYLEKKFGKDQVISWPVYRNLVYEAMKRNIDDRAEWDE